MVTADHFAVGADLETFIRRSVTRHIHSEDFQSGPLAERAERVAGELQLSLGAYLPTNEESDSISEQLNDIATLGLSLRCDLETGQEEYRFYMPSQGDMYNSDTMKSLNGSGQVVMAGLFAGLQVTRGNQPHVLFQSRVLVASPAVL